MTTLVLIPTPLELRILEPLLAPSIREPDQRLELCGFGPIAAAARTMQLIARHQPSQVMLVGLAGSLCSDLPLGSAQSFRRVACDGIGVGSGIAHQTASAIGWRHWVAPDAACGEPGAEIGDVLGLAASSRDAAGTLLTVCAASASDADVAMRLERHPDAVAEEMEGFGVAVACCFAGVPLQVIRGISNRAGDRDPANWMIDNALRAASQLVRDALIA